MDSTIYKFYINGKLFIHNGIKTGSLTYNGDTYEWNNSESVTTNFISKDSFAILTKDNKVLWAKEDWIYPEQDNDRLTIYQAYELNQTDTTLQIL